MSENDASNGSFAIPRRVLIFTAEIGFGHSSAANAAAAALQEAYGSACQVEILNLLDDPDTPAFLREHQLNYDNLVRSMPEVYRLRYQISDNPLPNAIIENVLRVSLYKGVRQAVLSFDPDVILTTHTMYPAPVTAVLAVLESEIPFITAVTDLEQVHRLWLNSDADLILVPTNEARQYALDLGLAPEQVVVTGIPVSSKRTPVCAPRSRSFASACNGASEKIRSAGRSGISPREEASLTRKCPGFLVDVRFPAVLQWQATNQDM